RHTRCYRDWSSDVCSSDLSTINVSSAAPTPGGLTVSVPSTVALGAHTLTVTATSGSLSHVASFPFYVADYSGSLSASTLAVTAEIGRASCRERGEVRVVGG